MALLEARGLVKQYGKRVVVKGVSLHVNAGEVVGLLGPNGAGKTTSFRMCVGMISPKYGEVFFNGKEITHMPMFKRARLGLGYLAQDSSVFRKLSVEQNLYAILELVHPISGKLNRKAKKKCVDKLLDQFGLTRLRKHSAITLSGGERRRLEIARCLVTEPMLIMLDEPFTGIDPKTVGDIQKIVRNLRDEGIGVLITDHHVLETLRITDRSYLIANGEMLTHGTPYDIVNNPKAREVYLGEDFITDGLFAENPQQSVSTDQKESTQNDKTPINEENSLSIQNAEVNLTDNKNQLNPTNESTQKTPNSLTDMLVEEQLKDLINRLQSSAAPLVAESLRKRGNQAIPALIEAMNRPEDTIRRRCFLILCEIVGRPLEFDSNANESERLKLIEKISLELNYKKAG